MQMRRLLPICNLHQKNLKRSSLSKRKNMTKKVMKLRKKKAKGKEPLGKKKNLSKRKKKSQKPQLPLFSLAALNPQHSTR